jgi:hypothetical protein
VSPPTGLSPLQANEDEAPLASHTTSAPHAS